MELSTSTVFITANNQELGSRLHSFTTAYQIDKFIKLFSHLMLLVLNSSQIKNDSEFSCFLVSLPLYGTTCAWKIKELLKELLLLEFDEKRCTKFADKLKVGGGTHEPSYGEGRI